MSNASVQVLRGEEVRHIVKVLRLTEGSDIDLVDGRGHVWHSRIMTSAKDRIEVSLVEQMPSWDISSELHVAIAPTKSIDRFEWFLEKATEIGIGRITPLLCEHSERKRLRIDRCQRILVSAMKQSQRSFLPQMDEMLEFGAFLDDLDGESIYIAHCEDGEKTDRMTDGPKTILIGPEGDFSPEEISSALAKGAKGLSLGQARLRTETAALKAVMLHNITE